MCLQHQGLFACDDSRLLWKARSGWFSSMLGFAAHVSDFGNEKLSELVSHEKVEDRVNDAVQKRQRSGQDVHGFDVILGRTVNLGPRLLRCDSDVSKNVIRGVDDEEHDRG